MPIPIPISILPPVGPTGYTNNDLLVIVNHYDPPFTGVTKNTYLTEVRDYILSGLSSTCISDFYVTNIHGCSPITIWDEVQSNGSTASATLSFAFGSNVTSLGDYSHSEGGNTLSVGYGSHSEGSGTTSIGYYSHTEGFDNVSGFKSFDGVSANTVINGTVVLTGGTDYTTEFPYPGRLILVTDSGVLILNYVNTAYLPPNFEIYLSDNNFNIGDVFSVTDLENLNSVSATTFYGKFSHSEGGTIKTGGNISLGEGSHSEGGRTLSVGDASHSEGTDTESLGAYSHAEGYNTKSFGSSSHSEGKNTQSLGDYSHSEGDNTISVGDYTHSEGSSTFSGWKGFTIKDITDGVITITSDIDLDSEFGGSNYFVFLGDDLENQYYEISGTTFSAPNYIITLYNTGVTTGNYISPSENLNSLYANNVLGSNSHSEGIGTKSIGPSSHSEGCDTISLSQCSHSEGTETIAWGYASHAEGELTISYGLASHSEGVGTIAEGDYQHVSGQYNLTGNTTPGAFIIGNGTDDLNRSNLLVAASSAVTITGQLGIGTTGISSSAAIQIDSITQGFLPPRMSATEAESITAVEGLMVYINDVTTSGSYITSKGWWGYTGNTSADWAKIGP
jgi:hypothetical protein